MLQQENWQKLNLAEQIGNIGSEFHRWLNTKSEKSFEEILALIDMTISDNRRKSQLGELTRLREVVCDFSEGSKFYGTNASILEDYFLGFAILARK